MMIRLAFALGVGGRALALGVLLFVVILLLLDATGGSVTTFRYESY